MLLCLWINPDAESKYKMPGKAVDFDPYLFPVINPAERATAIPRITHDLTPFKGS